MDVVVYGGDETLLLRKLLLQLPLSRIVEVQLLDGLGLHIIKFIQRLYGDFAVFLHGLLLLCGLSGL